MKRFLMLVGVAVVAAAMYVAAAPGSQQAKGPTARQFNALKKQVASLSKTVKALKTFAAVDLTYLGDCVQAAVPIDQFGDGQSATPTEGYEYSPTSSPGANTVLTTALDVAPSSDPAPLYITGGGKACATLINSNGLQHVATRAGVRFPRMSSHLPSFTAHRP